MGIEGVLKLGIARRNAVAIALGWWWLLDERGNDGPVGPRSFLFPSQTSEEYQDDDQRNERETSEYGSDDNTQLAVR